MIGMSRACRSRVDLMRSCLKPIAALFFGLVSNWPALAETEDEKWDFAWNGMIHILHHEIGHALVEQFEVPVIGQEEDAVDAFATLAVLETYSEPQPVLVDAAAAWFAMSEEADAAGDDPSYFDAHDLDIQRAYRIICIAHGYDPDSFAEVAKNVELPEDRLETCTGDADKALAGWDNVLTEAYRTEDGAGNMVTVNLGDATGFEDIKKRLDASNHANEIANWMDETYDWPSPISLNFEKCDEANAFYYSEENKVVMCYEFIAYLRDLADKVYE